MLSVENSPFTNMTTQIDHLVENIITSLKTLRVLFNERIVKLSYFIFGDLYSNL